MRVARKSVKTTSDELLSVVRLAEPVLLGITDQESSIPHLPGGWSRRQLLGHLIDSASNNHQRFVRAALQDSLEFPGYDQDACVAMQSPQDVDWQSLIALWSAYNRYLAHVIARLPASKLHVPCRIGDHDTVTLRFLVEDYLRHLKHHLAQIGTTPTG
jgi:hypothetical protein